MTLKVRRSSLNIIMLPLMILTVLSGVVTSCSSNYNIIVKQDGSAKVNTEIDYYDPSDINRYYQSEVISNIDTVYGRVTFEIGNIDSLGHYLPFHPQGFIQFKMDTNELVITDGHTKAFKDDNLFCCGMYMTISFDKEIQGIESANKRLKKKDTRTILFSKSRRQLIKGRKKTAIKIIMR